MTFKKRIFTEEELRRRKSRLVGSKKVAHICTVLHPKAGGLKLTKDNYIGSTKNMFGFELSEENCNKMTKLALENFDLNMQYFENLDKEKFNQALDSFLSRHPQFEEVLDLEEYDSVSGYYILVLDEYSQVYIGNSENIKRRVKAHWSTILPLDRLLFGNVDNSILAIDSFRAYDTTRIFARISRDLFSCEDGLLCDFPEEFCLNRTKGGVMSDGLMEATSCMRNRKLR